MGVYLSEPQTSKHITKGQNKKYSFVCAEMQGWRRNMQDAVIHQVDIGDGNALFGVFDGHGGFEVSVFVKNEFKKVLMSTPAYLKKDYINALRQTFKKIDSLIDSKYGSEELKKIRSTEKKQNGDYDNGENICNGTGCTANVILITEKRIFVANAGDSRSALCRGGKTIQLSQDHKPQCPIQRARINKAGGQITMGRVNGGLNLTRSFGDFDYKRNANLDYSEQMITSDPDIKQFERSDKDEFIICGCDGIWQRYVENSQELINKIKQKVNNSKTEKQSEKIIEDLLNDLLAKDTSEGIGCDNMSAIIMKFK